MSHILNATIYVMFTISACSHATHRPGFQLDIAVVEHVSVDTISRTYDAQRTSSRHLQDATSRTVRVGLDSNAQTLYCYKK